MKSLQNACFLELARRPYGLAARTVTA